MKLLLAVALAAAAFRVLGNEVEIQRSLIQRDQQSAEFAARVRGEDTARLEQVHARQLAEVYRPLQTELRPYQRQKMAEERALVLPPPTEMLRKPAEKPLPLPGGPRRGVELVAPHSVPN